MRVLLLLLFVLYYLPGESQSMDATALEKMPAELETDFALSALPSQLRSDATVYLLNRSKGY